MQGTVKWFDRSYGYITGQDGKEYFVHYTAINVNGYKSLIKDQKVEFDTEVTDRGVKAINVTIKEKN